MPTNTPSPPPKALSKGEPPGHAEMRGNLSKPQPGTIVALNFRVSADFKRDFKVAAAMHGITQSELLQQAFSVWQQHRG